MINIFVFMVIIAIIIYLSVSSFYKLSKKEKIASIGSLCWIFAGLVAFCIIQLF